MTFVAIQHLKMHVVLFILGNCVLNVYTEVVCDNYRKMTEYEGFLSRKICARPLCDTGSIERHPVESGHVSCHGHDNGGKVIDLMQCATVSFSLKVHTKQ